MAGPSRRGAAERRLLDAVAELSSRDGYVRLSVERVCATAGVSRATFYQYFANVDECFASAYRRHAEQLACEVAAALDGGEGRELAMLDVLVDTAIARPHVARLLMSEGHAAGATGRHERDALIAAIERAIAGAASTPSSIDLPTTILIGGVFRFLSMRLGKAEIAEEISSDVREWAQSFARCSSAPRWGTSFMPAPSTQPRQSFAADARARIGETPRRRMLRATAATICEKGYQAVTVADIVAAAGVSRRHFYNEFASKTAAAIAAYEQGFQDALGACAPAFFAAEDWRERVWQSALAFTGYLAREPTITCFGFVECYAIGHEFAARVHDTQLAFTLFLEEGYRQRSETPSLPRAASALIAASAVEMGFHASRGNPSLDIRRMLPLAVYVTLAPFIGSEAAGSFVSGHLDGTRSLTPAAA